MTAATKTKHARTDFTICVCTNDEHAVVDHRRHASPTEPSPAVVAAYPTGHIVERTVAWTPWKASS